MSSNPPSGHDRESSRAIRLAALLGSLFLHLLLVALLLHVTKPVVLEPPPASTTAIEVREISRPSARAAAPIAVKTPVRMAKRLGSVNGKGGTAGSSAKPTPPASAVATSNQEHRADAYAGDVPRALDLSLHEPLETASPGGETVHNRPGEVEPEGARPSLAQRRINEWIEYDTARSRVEKGLVDDWFMRLDKSLEHALDEAPVTGKIANGLVGQLFKNYASAASTYGATGTPANSSNLSNAGLEPSASAAGPLGPALGPAGTFKLQLDAAGLDPWAVIELSYDRGGKLRASSLLDSSGNSDFNSHVLGVVALGLVGLPDAPDGGQGIHPYGTRSVWRVVGHLTFERDVHHGLSAHDAWALPLSAATSLVGLGGGGFDEVTGYVAYHDWSHPHLHCQVELLQVY